MLLRERGLGVTLWGDSGPGGCRVCDPALTLHFLSALPWRGSPWG